MSATPEILERFKKQVISHDYHGKSWSDKEIAALYKVVFEEAPLAEIMVFSTTRVIVEMMDYFVDVMAENNLKTIDDLDNYVLQMVNRFEEEFNKFLAMSPEEKEADMQARERRLRKAFDDHRKIKDN